MYYNDSNYDNNTNNNYDDNNDIIIVDNKLKEELYKKVEMLNVVNITNDNFLLTHLYENDNISIDNISIYDKLLVALYNTNSVCATIEPSDSIGKEKQYIINNMESIADGDNIACVKMLKADDVINTYNYLFKDEIDENHLIKSLNDEFYYDSEKKLYYQEVMFPYGKINYFGYNYDIKCDNNTCDVYRAVGYSDFKNGDDYAQKNIDKMTEINKEYNEIDSENYNYFIKYKFSFIKTNDNYVINEIQYYDDADYNLNKIETIDYSNIEEGEKISLSELDKKELLNDLEKVENSLLHKNGDNIESFKFSLAIVKNNFSSLKNDSGATGSVSVEYDEFKKLYKKMFDEDFYLSKISGVLLRHNKLIFGEFSGIVDDGTEYEAEYKIKMKKYILLI